MKTTEKQLTDLVAQYLQLKKIMYRFDLAADLKLSMGQAVRNKKLHPFRGYPDLQILEPRKGYAGMFVELKIDESQVFKKNGDFKKNTHVQEQHEMHEKLRGKGYHVVWGLGYKDTIKKIEEYLNGIPRI